MALTSLVVPNPHLRPDKVIPAPEQEQIDLLATLLEGYWHNHMYGELPEAYNLAEYLVRTAKIRGPVTRQERADQARAEWCRQKHGWVKDGFVPPFAWETI